MAPFSTCSSLLTKFTDIIDQCKKHYENSKELAVETDEKIIKLCFSIEQILCHGLRSKIKVGNEKIAEFLKEFNIGLNSPEFWIPICYILPSSERERIFSLKFICSDLGRGRAWLRASLNERSLNRYLKCLFTEPNVLDSFYEPGAFLKEEIRQNVVLKATSDLSPIVFILNIDIPELNEKINQDKVNEPTVINATETISGTKFHRKHTQNVITFDESSTQAHVNQVQAKLGNMKVVEDDSRSSSTISEVECKSNISDESPSPMWCSSDNIMSVSGYLEDISSVVEEKPQSDSQTSSVYSTATSNNENEYSSLRILGDTGIGELIPIECHPASSVEEYLDTDERAVEALSSDAELDSLSICSTSDGQSSLHQPPNPRNIRLVYEEKVLELNRENELLKQQLRKYVTAVQLLKKEQGEGSNSSAENEVQLYEKKLVQLAIMHGELVELNTSLQMQIHSKDAMITKLSQELHALRGHSPSPVSVWLPSVFLGGGSHDPHHIYQIHIRIGAEEWNAYRRYSDFYKFNKEMQRRYPSTLKQISSKFPPKNLIFNKGNKSAHFVEERRQKLESYLRDVVACIAENTPEAVLNKSTLITLLPFLCDFRQTVTKNKKSEKNSLKRISVPCLQKEDEEPQSLQYNGL